MTDKVYLRRESNEPLELEIAAGTSEPATALARIVGSPWTEDGRSYLLYEVDLAPGVRVRPVDWRRHAYDHERIQALISACVRDQGLALLFEPSEPSRCERVAASMALALRDLGSVFDTKHVRIEEHDGVDVVEIEGEFKNGEGVRIRINLERG